MSLPTGSSVLAHRTQKGVTRVLLMPDGRHLVTACGDGLVRVFLADTCECVHVLKGHSGPVAGLAGLGGDLFVTGGANLDCFLNVWEASTGKRLFHRQLESWPDSVVGEMWALAAVDDTCFVVGVEVCAWFSFFLYLWCLARLRSLLTVLPVSISVVRRTPV